MKKIALFTKQEIKILHVCVRLFYFSASPQNVQLRNTAASKLSMNEINIFNKFGVISLIIWRFFVEKPLIVCMKFRNGIIAIFFWI